MYTVQDLKRPIEGTFYERRIAKDKTTDMNSNPSFGPISQKYGVQYVEASLKKESWKVCIKAWNPMYHARQRKTLDIVCKRNWNRNPSTALTMLLKSINSSKRSRF